MMLDGGITIPKKTPSKLTPKPSRRRAGNQRLGRQRTHTRPRWHGRRTVGFFPYHQTNFNFSVNTVNHNSAVDIIHSSQKLCLTKEEMGTMSTNKSLTYLAQSIPH